MRNLGVFSLLLAAFLVFACAAAPYPTDHATPTLVLVGSKAMLLVLGSILAAWALEENGPRGTR